jgi:putative flippase GtrA
MVGLVGTGVNISVYVSLTALRVNYLLAAGCAFVVAVTSNFIGHILWTFKRRGGNQSISRKYLKFFIISSITLVINLVCLWFLVQYIKLNEVIAQIISIAVISGLNFMLNNLFTFK